MNASDVKVTDEDGYLSRSKTIKANNKMVNERIWDTPAKMQLMSELLRLNTVCGPTHTSSRLHVRTSKFVGVTQWIRRKHKKLTLGGLIPADCVGREIWTRPR